MALLQPRRGNTFKFNRLRAGKDLHIQIGGDELPVDSPLSAPFAEEVEGDAATPLAGFRGSYKLVNLIGRDDALETATAWRDEPPADGARDERALVIHGAGGAGKTRLAAEILQAAKERGWEAGFLSSRGTSHPSLSQWTHPSRPTMIAVDYAEARRTDLARLFEGPPADRQGTAPFRVILIVREAGGHDASWLERLEGPERNHLGNRGLNMLDESALTVISLEESLPAIDHRRELWERAYRRYSKEERVAPDYLDEKVFESPLFVLLDAHRAQAGGSTDDPGARSEAELIRAILKHERKYWTEALTNQNLELTTRRLNQVAAVSTLVSGVDHRSYRKALASLDWLSEDEEMLDRVAAWWGLVYATGTGAIRGVEPDVVGEYLVMRALGEKDDSSSELDGCLRSGQLRSLIESANALGRQRMLRVLTRIATGTAGEEADPAKVVLAEILDRHIDEFLPATFSEQAGGDTGGGVGEPLAATVASAVLASDRLQLMINPPAKAEKGAGETGSQNAIKATAVAIVGRQIEKVATAELAKGRWSVSRFADVMAWVLRLDLEAGVRDKAEEKLAYIASLDPPPHRALAILRRELSRWVLLEGRASAAVELLEAGLKDLEQAGEEETELAYVITNDLGEALEYDRKTPEAIARYEAALAGFRKISSMDRPYPLHTLLNLTYSRGFTDLDGALELLDEAERELTAAGAEEEALTKVRSGRPRAVLAAGRAAVVEQKHEEGRALLERALGELSEAGEGDSLLACICTDVLGQTALAEGSFERAIELHEEALAGKRRLRKDVGNPGTLGTVRNLVTALLADDLERALQRLSDLVAELGEEPRAQEKVLAIQTLLMAEANRGEEAMRLAQANQEERIAQDTRQAIFNAAVDSAVEDDLPLLVGLDSCLLASRIFASGDPRLLPLASQLGRLIVERSHAITGVHYRSREGQALLRDERVNAFLGQLEAEQKERRRGSTGARAKLGVTPLPASFVREGSRAASAFADIVERIRLELDEALSDRYVAELRNAGKDEPSRLADDPAVRSWLLQASLWEAFLVTPELAGNALGVLLSAMLGLRMREFGDPPIAYDADEIWRRQPDPDLVAAEERQLLEDLEAQGRDGDGEARVLLALGKSHALRQAATGAYNEGETAEAEDLFKQALQVLEASGQGDSLPRYALQSKLAWVMEQRGDLEGAIDLGEEALAGMRALLGGSGEGIVLEIVSQLLRALAKVDRVRARQLYEGTVDELVTGQGLEAELQEIRSAWTGALRRAGRAALDAGEHELATSLYDEALEELRRRDEGETKTAFALMVDLGDVALAEGDAERALELFEQALEGSRRDGLANPGAIAVLGRMASTWARTDPERAEAILEAAIDELAGEENASEFLVKLRSERVGIRLARARHARESEELAKARELLVECLGELTQIGEGESLGACVVIHELGLVTGLEGNSKAAVGLFQRSLAGVRSHLGPTHPETVAAMTLVALAMAPTQLREAEEMLEGFCDELRQVEGEDAAAAIEALRQSRPLLAKEAALTRVQEDRIDEAKALLRRALDQAEELIGRDSSLVDTLLYQLGTLLEGTGEQKDAIEMLEDAVAGMTERLGPDAEETMVAAATLAVAEARVDLKAGRARIDRMLEEAAAAELSPQAVASLHESKARLLGVGGRAAEDEGSAKEAETLYTEALEELEAIDASDSLQAALIVRDLGDVKRDSGEPGRAVELFEEALARIEDRFAADDPAVIELIGRIAGALGAESVEAGLARLEQAIAELRAGGGSEEGVQALRRQRAEVLLRAGRAAEAASDLEAAEEFYLRALREGGTDEDNPILAHVLTHDLADVAAGKKDLKKAIELFEAAFEGKKRVYGRLEDPGTISTLLRLAETVAQSDLEGAISLLGNATEELEAEGAAKQSLEKVAKGRVILLRQAARKALAEDEPARAEELLRQARAVIEETGQAESPLAYTVTFDLADTRMTQGDRDETKQLLESALAGRREVLGNDHPDTLVTLNSLAGVLLPENREEAIALSDGAVEELVRRGAGGEALSVAKSGRAVVLLGAGRLARDEGDLEEAERLLLRSRDDLLAEEEYLVAAVTTHDLGDLARLRGETHRAIERYEESLEVKIGHQGEDHPDTLITLASSLEVQIEADPRAALSRIEAELARLAGPAPAGVVALRLARVNALHAVGQLEQAENRLEEAERRYREGLAEAEANRPQGYELSPLLKGALADVAALKGDLDAAAPLYRQALQETREIIGVANPLAVRAMAQLTGALAQLDNDEAIDFAEAAIREVEEAGVPPEALVRISRERSSALMFAGREHESRREFDQAQDLYRYALESLEAIGERGTHLAHVILHDLGDVALAKEDPQRAAELYQESLEGKKADPVADDLDLLATLSRLAELVAWTDLEGALALLAKETSNLPPAEDPALFETALAESRARVFLAASRGAADLGTEEIEELIRKAQAELDGVEPRDSSLAFVLLHELGDMALARKDTNAAAELYERALEGKVRVLGLTAWDTVTTLLALASALLLEDREEAFSRLEQAIEELGQLSGGEGAIVRIRSWMEDAETA